MNLPEYRRGYRTAVERFNDSIQKASEVLAQDLRQLDEAFFEDQDAEAKSMLPQRERMDLR